MGLFSLACTALSLYVWSITLYNVYHPLRQNVIQAVPSLSPGNVASVLYRLISESSTQSTPQTARRGRKPKRLTLAEAQREELRDALKALLIWLVCKGIEPALDNSLGYLVPFYTLFKAVVLLIFARFRLALSVQLFESFVAPLGKPNTPLVNLNAFTTLVFPALRFLLSLPFAHVKMLIRNFAMPLVASWTSADSRPTSAATSPVQEHRSIQDDRVPPPQTTHGGFEHRKPSGSRSTSRRDERKGGPGGPSGGESAKAGRGKVLKGQKSMDTLASASRIRSFDYTASQRSVSSQVAPTTQHVIAQLQSLPSAPRERPLAASAAPQSAVVGGSPGVLPTFAHIPVPTSSTPFKRLPDDLVPPPTLTPVGGGMERTPNSRSSLAFSPPPQMPGFLQGQAAQGSDPLQTDSQDSTIQPFVIQDQADESYVLEAPSESTYLATPAAQQQGESALIVEAETATIEKDADSQEVRDEAKKTSEKRKGVDDGDPEKEAKTRSPPSRRNRTKAAKDAANGTAPAKDARTPTAKKGENGKGKRQSQQKSTASEEASESSQASAVPRPRSTRKVGGSAASSSETSKATTTTRTRRQAASRSK